MVPPLASNGTICWVASRRQIIPGTAMLGPNAAMTISGNDTAESGTNALIGTNRNDPQVASARVLTIHHEKPAIAAVLPLVAKIISEFQY
jgi:hypothetical protein